VCCKLSQKVYLQHWAFGKVGMWMWSSVAMRCGKHSPVKTAKLKKISVQHLPFTIQFALNLNDFRTTFIFYKIDF